MAGDKVTRKDLRHFDKEATELLLWAQDRGARIRITARGHAVVFAPDGVGKATVPPKMKAVNRAGKNVRADLRRLFGKG